MPSLFTFALPHSIIIIKEFKMLEKYIKTARGQIKADLVLKNAAFVDVFSGKLNKGDIAVSGEKIVGTGEYEGVKEIDCSSFVVIPGLIDGHVHIESSSLSPEEFASLVVPRGTAAVIADPHEITNVCGFAGCEYIAEASKNVPLDVFLMLPSCVPATPFETSGATLAGRDIKKHIVKEGIFGLGEFMNYVGILNCDDDALKKAEAALEENKIIDGHCPSLSGKDLNAYLCAGIATDHECTGREEVEEKLSKGIYIQLRHGSTARNLDNAKYITKENERRFVICTDDRHAADLDEKGHIDDALRQMVKMGVDPITAVRCATLNTAECYNLKFRGGIAPFYFADLVVVDNLKDFNAKYVIKGGKVVAEDKKPLFDVSKKYLPANVLDTVHLRKLNADDFIINLNGGRAKAIKMTAGSLVTESQTVEIKSKDGDVVLDGDLLKLAVIERHKMTGNIGKGLLKGYGFKGGAIGLTVAHDSHNIIIAGDNNKAMADAANALRKIGGGIAVADGKDVLTLAFDVAGLMSSLPFKEVEKKLKELSEKAYKMGVDSRTEAFMSLAFLALPVIPHLKLTDKGLFDVDKFEFTSLEDK